MNQNPTINAVLNMSDAQLADSSRAAHIARDQAVGSDAIMAAHNWVGLVEAERRHRRRVPAAEAARMAATRVYLGGTA